MTDRVVPMIHVPDVAATVDWYRNIGFKVVAKYEHDGEGLSFAVLAFGDTEVMFNQGGRTSEQRRREVDLYVYTDDVEDVYQRLKERSPRKRSDAATQRCPRKPDKIELMLVLLLCDFAPIVPRR